MRINTKLDLALTVAAVFLLGIGVVAVILAGRLNEILQNTTFYTTQIERVAATTRGLRLTPEQTPAHLRRLQELATWARSPAEQELIEAARQQLSENHSVPGTVDQLESLSAHYHAQMAAAHQRLLVLHKRAMLGALVIMMDSILLFLVLVGLVRRWLLYPLQEVAEHLQRAAAGGAERTEPLRLSTEEPEFVALAQDANDLTSRLQDLAERCPKAERYAVVGEACTHFSHNFRTVLGSIRSLAQYEGDAQNADPNARAAFRFIVGTANKLDTWIRDVMTTVRPTELKTVNQAIEPIVQDAVSFLQPSATEKAIDILFGPGDDLPRVPLDRPLFEQALLAILVNAIDAAPEHGQVRVTVAGTDNGHVCVKIQDNGPGMTAETRQRACQAFFTTKQNGVGLGLTIAEKIMAQHGGRLEIESQPRQGTSVTLSLPLAKG